MTSRDATGGKAQATKPRPITQSRINRILILRDRWSLSAAAIAQHMGLPVDVVSVYMDAARFPPRSLAFAEEALRGRPRRHRPSRPTPLTTTIAAHGLPRVSQLKIRQIHHLRDAFALDVASIAGRVGLSQGVVRIYMDPRRFPPRPRPDSTIDASPNRLKSSFAAAHTWWQEGLGHAAIAERLGLSESTLRWMMARIRAIDPAWFVPRGTDVAIDP